MNIFDYKNSGTKLHKFRENYLLSPVETAIFESNIDYIRLFDDKSNMELVSRIVKFTHGYQMKPEKDGVPSDSTVKHIAQEIACALLINSHGALNLDYFGDYSRIGYNFIRALQFIFSRERIEKKEFDVIANEIQLNFVSRNSIGYQYMNDLRNCPYTIQVEDYVEQIKNGITKKATEKA